MAFVSMFFVMLLIFIVIVTAILIITAMKYVFESIFLYKYSKRAGYPHPLTAWIPIYNKCILGRAAGKENYGKYICVFVCIRITYHIFTNIVFLMADAINNDMLSEAISKCTEMMYLLPVVLLLVGFILNLYLAHIIIKRAFPETAIFLTLLNIFTLGFSRPIILFIIRNNDKIITAAPEMSFTEWR